MLLLLHESRLPAGMAVVVIIVMASTDFDPSRTDHESERPRYIVGGSGKAKDRRRERLGVLYLMVASYVTSE